MAEFPKPVIVLAPIQSYILEDKILRNKKNGTSKISSAQLKENRLYYVSIEYIREKRGEIKSTLGHSIIYTSRESARCVKIFDQDINQDQPWPEYCDLDRTLQNRCAILTGIVELANGDCYKRPLNYFFLEIFILANEFSWRRQTIRSKEYLNQFKDRNPDITRFIWSPFICSKIFQALYPGVLKNTAKEAYYAYCVEEALRGSKREKRITGFLFEVNDPRHIIPHGPIRAVLESLSEPKQLALDPNRAGSLPDHPAQSPSNQKEEKRASSQSSSLSSKLKAVASGMKSEFKKPASKLDTELIELSNKSDKYIKDNISKLHHSENTDPNIPPPTYGTHAGPSSGAPSQSNQVNITRPSSSRSSSPRSSNRRPSTPGKSTGKKTHQ